MSRRRKGWLRSLAGHVLAAAVVGYLLLAVAVQWLFSTPLGWLVLLTLVGLGINRLQGPRRPAPVGGRTWVYWLYDDKGVLLYVGITGRPTVGPRMVEHSKDPAEGFWWWRVDPRRTRTQLMASWSEAKALETATIKGRTSLPRPLYNRQENTAP